MDVSGQIAQFVRLEIALDPTIAHDEDLIETDLLDSAGIVSLLAFLEDECGILIDEDVDLVPDNFRTIDAIASFVNTKLNSPGGR